MTLQFPDVSSYQAGLRIQTGTVAVVAKATEGTYYQDPVFHDFMDQAVAVGAIRSGYHFLRAGNGAAQADYCRQFAGDVPMMIDCEPQDGSNPTVADCIDFGERFRELGGRVWGVYFPHWYWERVGGDLRPLRDRLGACLISSDYSGYTDSPTGAGWQSYGGLAPTIWQNTSSRPYGGQLVDFNAFRGTAAELRQLFTSGVDMQWSDPLEIPPAAKAAFPDFGFTEATTGGDLVAWTAARVAHIANHLPSPIDVAALAAKLGPLLHPTTNVAAVADVLAPHVGADPDALATAIAASTPAVEPAA